MPFSEHRSCAPSRQMLTSGDRFRLVAVDDTAFSVLTGRALRYICHRRTFETPVLANFQTPQQIQETHGFKPQEEVLLEWPLGCSFQATRVRDGKIFEIDTRWIGTNVEILDTNPRQSVQKLVDSASPPARTFAPAISDAINKEELVTV